MNKRYSKKGNVQTRMIEECAELTISLNNMIKEITKMERFDFFGYHPDDPNKTINGKRVLQSIQSVYNEIGDVKKVINELKDFLQEKIYGDPYD